MAIVAPVTDVAAPEATAQSRISIGAAVVFALIYLGVSGYLLFYYALVEKPAGNWDRVLVIYNGVVAVGFAAIGVLLGTQVQQVNVNNARKDADQAKAGEARVKAGVKSLLADQVADTGGGSPETSAALLRTRVAALVTMLE